MLDEFFMHSIEKSSKGLNRIIFIYLKAISRVADKLFLF